MFRSINFFQFSVRFYASPNRIKPFRKPKVYRQIESEAISIRAKGFLRSQKAYEPPKDARQQIENIIKELNISKITEKRFDFLNKCAAAFNHIVPNSRLHEMKSFEDVIEFYETEVDRRTPYELLDISVPNLHVIPYARRYDPETDGVSAFPKSSTLVTGLKYRKMYKGHKAKSSWP